MLVAEKRRCRAFTRRSALELRWRKAKRWLFIFALFLFCSDLYGINVFTIPVDSWSFIFYCSHSTAHARVRLKIFYRPVLRLCKIGYWKRPSKFDCRHSSLKPMPSKLLQQRLHHYFKKKFLSALDRIIFWSKNYCQQTCTTIKT